MRENSLKIADCGRECIVKNARNIIVRENNLKIADCERKCTVKKSKKLNCERK